ncbi:MAG: hypothetical protein ABSF25_24320, partial [Bryobacteraceae bacterium]
ATAQRTFADCNGSGVSVYSFERRNKPGLVPAGDFYHPSGDPTAGTEAVTDLIRDLAVFTGGKYTPPGDYDLVSYLSGVPAALSDYYLLGYAPSANSADKPCHGIKVKLNRKGLDVNARDSYCTSGQAAARKLKPAEKALEAASGVPGNLEAGLQLSWFYVKPGVAVVDIAMDIDPHLLKTSGKRHGEFNLLASAYGEDGSVAAQVGDTTRLDFETPAQLDEFLKTPYHYSNQFHVAPGSYRFRLAAGSGGQAFGKAEVPLDIEPWTGQTLSVSGLALSAGALRLTGVTAELDGSLLEGPHLLRSKGRSIAPMGSTRFDSGRDGVFYFEVCDPGPVPADLGAPVQPPMMRMRLLDRPTGREKLDSGPIEISGWRQAGGAVIPIMRDLPVSKLVTGSYTLEVSVTRGGDAMVRTANFEVK